MKKALFVFAMLLSLVAFSNMATAVDWDTYSAPDWGISMSVVKGTQMAAKEYQDGWGGAYGKHGDVEMLLIGKKDPKIALADMQAFAIAVSGVGGDFWTKLGEGKGDNGWAWYQTFVAADEKTGDALFAILCQNTKASFVIFLKTTVKDVQANEAVYKQWLESIKSL